MYRSMFYKILRYSNYIFIYLVYIYKGGNVESDSRLQVVKLLTVLSYSVGRSDIFCVPALFL